LEVTFRKQRKRIAAKLQDPKIIQIQFHIFRHWKVTVEYTKTKEQWYVQKLLETKHQNNNQIQLNSCLCHKKKDILQGSQALEEATSLNRAGFQNIIDINEYKLLRKLKTSYLGS